MVLFINNEMYFYSSSFPKDQTRRKQWTEALALYNWTPAKKSVVCSKHFLDTHFVNDLSRNRKLTHSAVPCIIPKPDFDMRRVSIIYNIQHLRYCLFPNFKNILLLCKSLYRVMPLFS